MKIQLYYAPVTCALAPFITLTEAKAEFEVMPVNMRKGQNKSPAYMKLNPKHKVPLLVVDGRPLTENVAIQLWIAPVKLKNVISKVGNCSHMTSPPVRLRNWKRCTGKFTRQEPPNR